jgi:acyl-CoA thioester hydrolase
MTEPTTEPFHYILRVRYHECDGQKVVFNARYAEYVDVAALEYTRALFGGAQPSDGGIDWRLVHQSIDWKAPATFDDILYVEVQTESVGKTSFTLCCEVRNIADQSLLVTARTVYVVYDESSEGKVQIADEMRQKLLRGAPNRIVDCSGREPS